MTKTRKNHTMNTMKTIFAVDDSDTTLSRVIEVLEDHYRVMTMSSAAKMFELLEKFTPDLILLDIEMPKINGIETLLRLKSNESWTGISVMFLTSRTDAAIEARGFEMGAVDFVTKPFSAPVLMNRIKTHLDIDELIRKRTAQLYRLQNSMVSVLADMVETRDKSTGGHIERTSIYIKILVDGMKERGVYTDEIQGWDTEKIVSSARMHDLGKIAISDTIMNKPGKLTSEEYELMKTHTVEGERIIDAIIAQTGEEEFLRNAKLFAGNHHERWDGAGYPYQLKETQIPLQGRVMAVVDVYDALVSERSYKKALPHEEAVRIIMEGTGTQFDPKIAEVFFAVKDKFLTTQSDLHR